MLTCKYSRQSTSAPTNAEGSEQGQRDRFIGSPRVKNELYETFITNAKERYKEKFGRSPKVYDVVISDGSRKLC